MELETSWDSKNSNNVYRELREIIRFKLQTGTPSFENFLQLFKIEKTLLQNERGGPTSRHRVESTDMGEEVRGPKFTKNRSRRTHRP